MYDVTSSPAVTDVQRLGDELHLTLTLELPERVHIEPHEPPDPFLIPTVVTVDGLEEVTVRYPEPVAKDLGWHDAMLLVLEGSVEFRITGSIGAGTETVSGTLRFQPCVGGACLPPRTTTWTVAVPDSATVLSR